MNFQQIYLKKQMFGTFNNQQGELKKTTARFRPAMVYGHSQQSPFHMTNKYTIYYEPAQKRASEFIPSQLKKQNPAIKQEFNISKQFQKGYLSNNSNSQKETSQNFNFNLTRGTFSTFLDNHKHYQSISVLHRQIKKTNAQDNKTAKLRSVPSNQTQTTQNYYTSQPSNKEQSIADSKNTRLSLRSNSLGFLRASIRERRQQFAEASKKQYELLNRRKDSNFQLGRRQNRQLVFLSKQRKTQKIGSSQMQQMSHELQQFQNKLFKKLK